MIVPSPLVPAPMIAVPRRLTAEPRQASIRHDRRHDALCKVARLLGAGLLVTLLLLMGLGRAQGDSQTPKHIIDLLYPQSAGWTRLSTFPHPSPHLFDDPMHVETLGYFDRLQTGADRCSPILRMFLGRDKLRRFRTANVFGPGDDDLVYAGPKPCAEGDWTIIWRHGLNYPAQVSVIVLDAEVQLVLAGPQPKAVGVAPGCCGDPWNYYCVYEPIPHETCTAVPGALVIPHTARLVRSEVTLRQDVKLLPAPNVTLEPDDPYQPPVRTAGTTADQLMIASDNAGRSWRLVRVAAKPGEVSGSASFVVGWVGD
jgi:hypothetical protein